MCLSFVVAPRWGTSLFVRISLGRGVSGLSGGVLIVVLGRTFSARRGVGEGRGAVFVSSL